MKIHLLQTNDIHSQLENYMRLAASLRQQRARLREQGDAVLTFDIGDILDRVRPETEATYGAINAAMMAAVGYDAWVFGNNEGLTIPVDRWDELRRLSGAVVFGSNLRTSCGSQLVGFADSQVFTAGGVRIGVFGVTAAYKEPYELLDVDVTSPFAAAAAQVDQLHSQGCDIVVALSHLGLWDDRKLAVQVPGIDVVLGSHSHNFMEAAEVIEGTAVFQPGAHGLRYGHTVIDFDTRSGCIQSIDCEAIAVDLHGPLDADTHSVYREYRPVFDEVLNQPVVCLPRPLPVRMDSESPLANILVEGLFERYPCDLGMMMAGALNASLRAGQIRRRHVHGACATPTRPVLLTLSGENIRNILEKSMSPEYYNQTGRGYGFRGGVIGFMAVANVDVEFALTHKNPRIHSVLIAGQPLNPLRRYRIVTCEYLWLSTVFAEFREAEDIQVQVPLVREVLGDALANPRVRDQADVCHYHRRDG